MIGLDPYRVPGPWDPKPIIDAIIVGITRFAKHNVPVKVCLFGLDGSDDMVAVVTAALRSYPWKCVVIGGGVRKNEKVEMFESIINLVRQNAPNAAIAFSKAPDDTYDAAARWIAAPKGKKSYKKYIKIK